MPQSHPPTPSTASEAPTPMLTFHALPSTEAEELGRVLALCYRIARERARLTKMTQAQSEGSVTPLVEKTSPTPSAVLVPADAFI